MLSKSSVDHLREAYPQGGPEYDNKSLNADSKSPSSDLGDIVPEAELSGRHGRGSDQRRDTRHQHSIWQDIQAKNIYLHEFLSEKMEYLHSNPVSKDWQLVKERGDYRYSSACFYDNGDTPIIPITDINEWLML